MNWILFGLAVPTAVAVVVAHLFTAYFVSSKPKAQRLLLFGSLKHTGLFSLAATTYVVSSVGCCISFFLFLLQANPEFAAMFIFLVWNFSCCVFDWALLHARQPVVLACVVANTVCGIALFIYTGVAFDLLAPVAQKPVVLVAHCCNAVSVFHVTIIDLVIWYDSWATSMRAREPQLIAVWAGEPHHAPEVPQMRL